MGKHPKSEQQKHSTTKGKWSRFVVNTATWLSVGMVAVLVGGLIYGSSAASGHLLSQRIVPSPAAGNQVAGNATAGVAGGKVQPSYKHVRVVALGDSLTHGFGDASGAGYVGDVVKDFQQQGSSVTQTNVGIDGLTSAGLLKQLQHQQLQTEVRAANLILISIGGNDLNDAAGLPNINKTKITAAQIQFRQNLKTILTQIRAWNANAPILLVGLYNPYGNILQTRAETNSIVLAWNADELNIVSHFSDTVVVETYDLFHLDPTNLLYLDHFHPNQTGYRLIAERIWEDLQGSNLVRN